MGKETIIEALKAQNRAILAMLKMLRGMQTENERMLTAINRGVMEIPTGGNPSIPQSEVVRVAGIVISRLNAKAGRTFDPTAKNTLHLIRRLLEEGRSEEELSMVVDSKCLDWDGSEFQCYLRPETLFGEQHFESYLVEAQANRKDPYGTGKVRIEGLKDLELMKRQQWQNEAKEEQEVLER